MHIKNDLLGHQKITLIVSIPASIVCISVLIYAYIYSGREISFIGFFSLLINFIFDFKNLSVELNFMRIVFLIALFSTPFAIHNIYSYFQEKKKLQLSNNLKSINFLPNIIHFNFFQPYYNFYCTYSQIQKCEMIIRTQRVHTKHSYTTGITEIIFNIVTENGQTFSLKKVPLFGFINYIYSIIDATRSIKNFSYKICGTAETESLNDLIERINDCKNKGIKQLLGYNAEAMFKLLSIIFFCFGIYFIFSSGNTISTHNISSICFVLGFSALLFLPAFILDIVLIIDKIRERKF